jgi:surface protein
VITVQTDNPGETFTIQTYGSGYDYNVDCDDDGNDDILNAITDSTCSYGAAGTYTITISSATGTGFPRIYFNNGGDKEKLLTIEQWGTGQWTSMNSAFYGCINLTVEASDAPDLSNVIDLNSMFRDATSFNQDISGWTTTNVKNMSFMFRGAAIFNQNINGWDTSNVTNMSFMFNDAVNINEYLNNWDTSKVTNMTYMFKSANSFNKNLNN